VRLPISVSRSAAPPKTIITTARLRPLDAVRSAAPKIPATKIATLNATGRNELATSAFSPPAVVSAAQSWVEDEVDAPEHSCDQDGDGEGVAHEEDDCGDDEQGRAHMK
jgi:hypothetical protein